MMFQDVMQADMAELADALDLGSSVSDVQVQVLLSALNGAKQDIGCSGFAPFCAWDKNTGCL